MAAPTSAEMLDEVEMEHSTLAAYAHQLQSCLEWEPLQGVEGQSKQLFVEALTEIAALPLDSISMEIRRLLVVSSAQDTHEPMQQHAHLRNIIAALNARDVQLKCKAANAVGSLCISRVAGQLLLEQYGQQILTSVTKNQWVQGDAFFVLGWVVVIADEAMLASIAELLPTVVKFLHRNVNLPLAEDQAEGGEQQGSDAAARRSKAALATSEQASNFRVYALVLLLNFSQRHVDVFADQLEQLLPMLRDLVARLLGPAPSPPSGADEAAATTFDVSEYAEVLRLTITLLSGLVDQLDAVASQLLELKVLPSLLKLKRVLDTPLVRELVGETGIQDIAERLDVVIDVLLNAR
jgi:hypothetical protein